MSALAVAASTANSLSIEHQPRDTGTQVVLERPPARVEAPGAEREDSLAARQREPAGEAVRHRPQPARLRDRGQAVRAVLAARLEELIPRRIEDLNA